MYVLVNGTTVIAHGTEPPTSDNPEDVLFEVLDFPEISDGFVLHWDGTEWWEERDVLSPQDVLTAMFAASPETLQALPDEALSKMAPYMEEWAEDVGYSVGDLRSFAEEPYRCLTAHTSQASWEPDVSPSLWARVLPGQGGDIGEWVQPDSTNPYMKGDKVTHNGKTWESVVDNNVWEPGVYGWEEI